MVNDLRQQLVIPTERVEAINSVLLNPDLRLINDFLAVVAKYGTPEEINQQAAEAGQLEVLLQKVEESQPSYLSDLEWLKQQRKQQAFISIKDYREKILGDNVSQVQFNEDCPGSN